jgi:O-antigen/teichoic acid export membrane protein
MLSGVEMAHLWQESKLLAKHSSIYAAGTAMQRLAGFLLLPLYTKYLTPSDYGIKEILGLTTEVLSILLATGIFRFYFDFENERDRNGVISTAMLSVAGVGLLVLPGLVIVSPWLANVMVGDATAARYLRVALITLLPQLLNRISFDYLKAKQRSVFYVCLSLGRLVSAILLNVYFIVYLGLGIYGIFLSALISSLLLFCCLSLPLLWHLRPVWDRKKLAMMTRYGAPVVPSQLASFVVMVSDRFMLRTFSSLAVTGIYSLALRFGTLPSTFISQPFNQTWLPRRFEIAKQADSEQIFGRVFTYFLVLITGAGLAVAVLARDAIYVMADPRFHSAVSIVPVIVLANIIFTFHYHLSIGLLVTNNTKYLALANIINSVLVISLNFYLIPRFGGMGAAAGLVVAYTVRNSLIFIFSRKFYRIHFEYWRVLKILLSAASVYLGLQLIKPGSIWVSAVIRSALLIAYPGLLWLLRFFNDDEIQRARRVFTRLRRRNTAITAD